MPAVVQARADYERERARERALPRRRRAWLSGGSASAWSGAGMIAQVEHIPNLLHLADRFELAGVADPSARVRAAIAERHGVRGFATAAELLAAAARRGARRGARPAARGDGARRARRRAARLLREAALLHRGRGRRHRRRPRPGRPRRPGRLHEAVRSQLRGGPRLPARGRRGAALHLGRGLRPGLLAVRRPPAARAPRRRARRPHRRHPRPPARAGRRGARDRGRQAPPCAATATRSCRASCTA